jgi:hypothetical protein
VEIKSPSRSRGVNSEPRVPVPPQQERSASEWNHECDTNARERYARLLPPNVARSVRGASKSKGGWLALSVNNVAAYSAKRLLVSRIGVARMKGTFSGATTGHTSPLPFDLASRLFRRASRVRHLFRVTRLSAPSTPSSRSNLSLIARNRDRGSGGGGGGREGGREIFLIISRGGKRADAMIATGNPQFVRSYGLQGEPQLTG